MDLFLLLFLLIILFLLLLLWACLPNFGRKKACMEFARWPYAHRGLWNIEQQIPENSLPAFAQAVKYNFAIELDVHLTADGQLVVFHDDSLERMCQLNRQIETMSYKEIIQCRLLGTEHHAPLLSEVLDLVDGKVPLLIELKLPGRSIALCPVLDALLSGYSGKYLIESFQPMGLRWFRKNRPSVLRGQLSDRYAPSVPTALPLKLASTQLLMNFLSRPDFIAYSHEHFGSLGSRLNYHLFKTPFWVWTVRTEEAYVSCCKLFDGVIFEKFIPTEREER